MKRYLTFEIGAVLFAIIAVVVLAFSLTPRADANQSEFCRNQLNGSATTTVSYLTAGTGTSTVSATNCSDGSTAIDSALLTWQATSSSTPPSLTARVEVSRDGIDWYPSPATTTPMLSLINEQKWATLASSTDMAGTGGENASTTIPAFGTRYHGSMTVSTPEPFVRVKLYVPVGAPAIGLSAELMVKREKLAR